MLAWTQNLAVGNQDYVEIVKLAIGIVGRYRSVVAEYGVHTLKEAITPYMVHLGPEKKTLSDDNTIFMK